MAQEEPLRLNPTHLQQYPSKYTDRHAHTTTLMLHRPGSALISPENTGFKFRFIHRLCPAVTDITRASLDSLEFYDVWRADRQLAD